MLTVRCLMRETIIVKTQVWLFQWEYECHGKVKPMFDDFKEYLEKSGRIERE